MRSRTLVLAAALAACGPAAPRPMESGALPAPSANTSADALDDDAPSPAPATTARVDPGTLPRRWMTPSSTSWVPIEDDDGRRNPIGGPAIYVVSDAKGVREVLKQHKGGAAMGIDNKDVCRMKRTLARERARAAVNLSVMPPELNLAVVACLREIRPQALGVESWGNHRAPLSPAIVQLLSHLDGVEALAVSYAGSSITKMLGDRAATPDGAALRSLAFMSPHFDAADLAALAKRKNLQAVSMRGLERESSVAGPTGIAALATLTRLEHLDLSYGPVTDDDLADFSHLPELRWLSFESTQVGDAGLAAFAHSPELRHVNLGATKVTDASLPIIAKWTHLSVLELGGRDGKITDRAALALASLKELRWLDLRSTRLTDAALASLSALPALQQVYLPPTMTIAAVERWKQAHPNLEVGHEKP